MLQGKKKPDVDSIVRSLSREELEGIVLDRLAIDDGVMENAILSRFAPNGADKVRRLVRSLVANRSDDRHGFIEDAWGLSVDLERLRKSVSERKGPHALRDRIITSITIAEELAPSWWEVDSEEDSLMETVTAALDDLLSIARNHKYSSADLLPLRSWALANLDAKWAQEGDGWDSSLLELFIETARSEEELDASLAECERRCDPARAGNRNYSIDRAAELMLVALRGKRRSEARKRFIEEHLDLAPVRHATIDAAMATRDFDKAEALARTGIDLFEERKLSDPSRGFSPRLIHVLETRGDADAALSLIEGWTMEQESLEWYDEIRKRLKTRESRIVVRDRIIAATVKKNVHFAAAICAKEGLVEFLHELALANKTIMGDYYRTIGKRFPESAARWLESFLRKDLTRTHSRNGYAYAADRLKEYARFAGADKSRALAAELIATYPRRPAMREELERAVKSRPIAGSPSERKV